MAATFTTDSCYIHAPLHPAVCKEDTLSITNVESCMREILYQILRSPLSVIQIYTLIFSLPYSLLLLFLFCLFFCFSFSAK